MLSRTNQVRKSMSHLDNLTLANKKNIVGKSRLNTELNRINREQMIEMRMHKNARQRFKNKYVNKLDVFDENRGSEASDVVMYETHNPGFCYRRNGECRLQQSCIMSSSVNMQDLHILLFTKGEIDIDKVLCLYLLTAHKCETLRTPPKSQRATFLARQQSPLERLIDRTKIRAAENQLSKLLPLYILDTPLVPGKKDPMKDQRLSGKIIINTKIIQIIDSVRNALEMCNNDLLQCFLNMANDKKKIQAVLEKPKMIGFFKSLYGQNIISSCESFQLELPPKEGIIYFRVEVDPFEELIKVIRQNVLLLPNSNTWKVYNVAPEVVKESDGQSEENIEKENEDGVSGKACNEGSACAMLSKLEKKKDDNAEKTKLVPMPIDGGPRKGNEEHITNNPQPKPSKTIRNDFSLQIEPAEGDLEQRETVAQLQPKILKNLQLGFSEVKVDDELPPATIKQESLPLDTLANLLSKKVKKESKMEYRNMISDLTPPLFYDDLQDLNNSTPDEAKEAMSTCTHGSYSLKQTTCDACLKRWTHPLPTPKISKIKKYELPQLKDTSYFSSRSAQRISELINDEVRKFEQDEANETAQNKEEILSNRMYKKLAKGNYLGDTSIEIIDLDEMELAKIRQEIKEIETEKKLKEFLEA